ncbi:unnamed protein product [Camellia sinensis]
MSQPLPQPQVQSWLYSRGSHAHRAPLDARQTGTPFHGTSFDKVGTPFEGTTFEGSIYIYMYIFWAAYLHTHTVSSTPVSFINPFVSTSNRFLSSHLFEFEGGLYTVSCISRSRRTP